MDHDLRKQRKHGFEAIPYPDRQPFACRILQTLDVVEVMVIQLIVKRLKSRLHIGKIHDPASFSAQLALKVNLHPERVPVQARALVAWGHVGQAMRRLEGKDFEDIHASL